MDLSKIMYNFVRYFVQMDSNTTPFEESCGACMLKDRCHRDAEDCFTRRQRWKALTLGYILPFVVLVAVIAVLEWQQWNEMLIGGVALGFVAVYYLILWMCKPKI